MNTLQMNGARLEEGVFLPAAAGSTVTFNTGDMLTWSATNGYVSPVSSYTWATDDATTRRALRQYYCGIAGESQFPDSPARLVKVYTFAEIDVTCDVSTAWTVGDLCGPAGNGSSVMYNQKIANVINATAESIGKTVRVYASDSKVIAKVQLYAVNIGAFALRTGDMRVAVIADGLSYAGSAVLSASSAHKIFGGGAEVLSLGAIQATAAGTITGTLAKNGTPVGTALTITGGGRGTYTEQSQLTSYAGLVFGANDTITLTEGGGGSGTVAQWMIRFRPLF